MSGLSTRHEKTSLSLVKGVGKGAWKATFDYLMTAFDARQSLTLTTPLTAVIDSKGRLCLTFDPRLWRVSKVIFDAPLPFIKGVAKGVGKYTCASSQKWFKDIVKHAWALSQRSGKGSARERALLSRTRVELCTRVSSFALACRAWRSLCAMWTSRLACKLCAPRKNSSTG